MEGNTLDINWTALNGMILFFTAAFSVISFLITKLIVAPMLTRKIDEAMVINREQFVPIDVYQAQQTALHAQLEEHLRLDERRQEVNDRQFDLILKKLFEDKR